MTLSNRHKIRRYEICSKDRRGGLGELYRTDNSRNLFTVEAIKLGF